MPLPDPKTISFSTWPLMVMIQGPSDKIAAFLQSIYNDPMIPRESWSVTHNEKSRLDYAAKLAKDGEKPRRQGMGLTTSQAVEPIERRAKTYGLSFMVFAGETRGLGG